MKVTTLYLLTALWAAGAAMSQGAGPDFPARAQRQAGAFVITYSVGDEAYAEALARQLPDFKLPPAEDTRPTLALSDLRQRRQEILRRVAAFLALPEPLPDMVKIYDGLLANFVALSTAVDSGVPRHFALWRRNEMRARLQAGERIPGFTLRESGEIYFNLSFDLKFGAGAQDQSPAELAARASAAWAQLEVPMPIAADSARPPAEDIAALLLEAGQMLTALRVDGVASFANPFVLLHETTEVTIIQHYLASADRRWFCDGVANYIAWKVLADTFGADEARRYYDLDAQLRMYAAEAPHIDLERWPASEHLAQANYSEDLNTANYAFATKVFADVHEKHGDVLPRLFAELGRTPREKASMQTVYRAFTRLTKEDLKRYLPRSGGK